MLCIGWSSQQLSSAIIKHKCYVSRLKFQAAVIRYHHRNINAMYRFSSQQLSSNINAVYRLKFTAAIININAIGWILHQLPDINTIGWNSNQLSSDINTKGWNSNQLSSDINTTATQELNKVAAVVWGVNSAIYLESRGQTAIKWVKYLTKVFSLNTFSPSKFINVYLFLKISMQNKLFCCANIYLLLAECEVRTASYGPSFSFLLWPKCEARGPWKQGRKKRESITCRTDRANEANKMFIIWLYWLFRFWKGDRELEVRTATYKPGIDQLQHAKSVSHIIKELIACNNNNNNNNNNFI